MKIVNFSLKSLDLNMAKLWSVEKSTWYKDNQQFAFDQEKDKRGNDGDQVLAPKENDNEEVVSKDMEIVDSDGEDDDNNKRTAIAIVSSSENNIGQKRNLLQKVSITL